ncbi:hypothetical protein [Thermus caldifontis]|uniref:hypothetical protein n=1 Tax=Thermus caldifontis TaxID=1930763 RepID=UPI000DF28D8B|nr:hypothetical protein [Thermus caldifontis]
MKVERTTQLVGRGIGFLGAAIALLSLFRLDGTGLGLGLILGLYGFGIALLGHIYAELKAIRAYMAYLAVRTKDQPPTEVHDIP